MHGTEEEDTGNRWHPWLLQSLSEICSGVHGVPPELEMLTCLFHQVDLFIEVRCSFPGVFPKSREESAYLFNFCSPNPLLLS